MKNRFRIVPTDEILAGIYHKGKLIQNFCHTGFSNINQVKKYCIEKLGYPYKGYGRRIEIGIHNLTKNEIKYINTFS
jgi:hypothetical protein